MSRGEQYTFLASCDYEGLAFVWSVRIPRNDGVVQAPLCICTPQVGLGNILLSDYVHYSYYMIISDPPSVAPHVEHSDPVLGMSVTRCLVPPGVAHSHGCFSVSPSRVPCNAVPLVDIPDPACGLMLSRCSEPFGDSLGDCYSSSSVKSDDPFDAICGNGPFVLGADPSVYNERGDAGDCFTPYISTPVAFVSCFDSADDPLEALNRDECCQDRGPEVCGDNFVPHDDSLVISPADCNKDDNCPVVVSATRPVSCGLLSNSGPAKVLLFITINTPVFIFQILFKIYSLRLCRRPLLEMGGIQTS